MRWCAPCDGEEALRRVGAEAFDAVFLDVRMPGLDGLELARVLRQFARRPELVFVSAHDEAAVEAFELRALDYLRKPAARGGWRRRSSGSVRRGRTLPGRGLGLGLGRGLRLSGATMGTRWWRCRPCTVTHGGCWRATRSATSPPTAISSASSPATAAYLLRVTLTELEHRWAPHGFVRVHRQYIVNLHRAIELRPQLGGTAELAFADGVTVPVARRHLAELDRRLRAA